MPADHRIMQRIVAQGDALLVLSSDLHRFLDRHGHFTDFTGLAVAEADVALTVTYDRQSREAELPTTLDDLRHSIDGDELFDQIVRLLMSLNPSHVCLAL